MLHERRKPLKNVARYILVVFLAAGCATTHSGTGVQSVQLVQSGASWDGRPLPPYATGNPEITILRITIPPGHTLPMHRHPVINAGVLLKGELTVRTENGDVLHLRPYDPIVEVVDTWHWGENEGDTPAEIVVFYAGEKGAPITVKETEGGSSGRKEP